MSRPDDITFAIHAVKNDILPKLIELYREIESIIYTAKLSTNYDSAMSSIEKSNFDILLSDAGEDLQHFSNFIWE